jgi:hypothetical protein
MDNTSGERGGADLIVHTVFRLLNHTGDTNAPAVRVSKFRFIASSALADNCANVPCFAAIFWFF